VNRHLRLVFTFALACLLVGGASGCGMMRLRGDGVEPIESWPLAERVIVGMDPTGAVTFSGPSHRPSLLVRISLDAVAELIEQEQEPFLSLKYYKAPLHSGLFSSVTYQHGTEDFRQDTDFTLDFELRASSERPWYSWPGIVTIGALPFFEYANYTLLTVVRDEKHEVIGEVEREDSFSDVIWLPFLPINMVVNAIDLLGIGTSLGLTREGWSGKQKAVIETLFRSTLVEVRDLILAAVKKRREAEEKQPEVGEETKSPEDTSGEGSTPDESSAETPKEESTTPPSDGPTDGSEKGD
jgi:hypothetical protein